eukprot:scaffold64477_cov52-Attheya_sp.AAC.3
MAEPTARFALHNNQPFKDQLGHPIHTWKAPTMAHLTLYSPSFSLHTLFKEIMDHRLQASRPIKDNSYQVG